MLAANSSARFFRAPEIFSKISLFFKAERAFIATKPASAEWTAISTSSWSGGGMGVKARPVNLSVTVRKFPPETQAPPIKSFSLGLSLTVGESIVYPYYRHFGLRVNLVNDSPDFVVHGGGGRVSQGGVGDGVHNQAALVIINFGGKFKAAQKKVVGGPFPQLDSPFGVQIADVAENVQNGIEGIAHPDPHFHRVVRLKLKGAGADFHHLRVIERVGGRIAGLTHN